MRVSPDDRRNLAQLGLTVLVVGLVVAPLSHILADHAGLRLGRGAETWVKHGAGDAEDAEHAHPHPHDHGEQGGHEHTHPPESVQHLTALFAPAAAPAPVVRAEGVALAGSSAPALPRRAVDRVHPAMPQGP